MDHDNLNRFYGITIDGPEQMSVWRFCSRGSLQDVISNNTLSKDGFFVYTLVRELCEVRFFELRLLNVHVCRGCITFTTRFWEAMGT